MFEGEFDPPEDGVPEPPDDGVPEPPDEGELLLPPLDGLLFGGRGDTTNAAALFSAATGELASDASDETLASFTATTVTEYWFVLSLVWSSTSSPLTTTGSPAAVEPCRSCTEYEVIGDPPLEDGGDQVAFNLKSSVTETVGWSGVDGFPA